VVGAIRFIALGGFTSMAAVAAAACFDLRTRSEQLLAAGVLWVAIATVSALALGMTGNLRYDALLASQITVAGAALAAARASRSLARIPRLFWPLPPLPATAFLRAAVVAVGGTYAWVAFLGFVTEPFSGDALMYHLPIAVAYAREGRVTVPELGRYWNADLWAYYPGGAYLLDQWALLPWQSGVLVDLVQLPFAAGSAVATHVLARRLGCGPRGAAWGALLFLAVPIVIGQSKTALVDVVLTFLFAAGLALALALPANAGRLLLVALAWGTAPGVKISAWVFLLLGIGCVAARSCSELGPRAGLKATARCGLAAVGAGALLSGYWYARNYLLQGHPLYPANIVPGDALAWTNVLVYGPLLPLLDLTVYDPVFTYNYETGAGAQFAALALPASVAFTRGARRDGRSGLVAVALVPAMAYAFWLLRSSRSPHTLFRYVLPAMPAGFAAAGWLLEHTTRRALLEAVAFACVLFSLFNAAPHVGTFLAPEALRTALRHVRNGTGELGRFDHMGDLALQDYRRTWRYLDLVPGSADIAASHIIFAYPMVGENFRHRLHFLPPMRHRDWIAELRRLGIDYVAVAQLQGRNARLLSDGTRLRLTLLGRNTGDELVIAAHRMGPLRAQRIRLTYRVARPENVRAAVGMNSFAELFDLDPQGGAEATAEWAWTGELDSVELLLEAVPRTRAWEDRELSIAALEVQDSAGKWIALDLDPDKWNQLAWPPEYRWMAADPERFSLVHEDTDVRGSPYSGALALYRVENLDGAQKQTTTATHREVR